MTTGALNTARQLSPRRTDHLQRRGVHVGYVGAAQRRVPLPAAARTTDDDRAHPFYEVFTIPRQVPRATWRRCSPHDLRGRAGLQHEDVSAEPGPTRLHRRRSRRSPVTGPGGQCPGMICGVPPRSRRRGRRPAGQRGGPRGERSSSARRRRSLRAIPQGARTAGARSRSPSDKGERDGHGHNQRWTRSLPPARREAPKARPAGSSPGTSWRAEKACARWCARTTREPRNSARRAPRWWSAIFVRSPR